MCLHNNFSNIYWANADTIDVPRTVQSINIDDATTTTVIESERGITGVAVASNGE